LKEINSVINKWVLLYTSTPCTSEKDKRRKIRKYVEKHMKNGLFLRNKRRI